MTITLPPFIQNQDYEGIKFTYKKKTDNTVLDISGLTTATMKVFYQDFSAVLFSGDFPTELTFLTDGTDGILVFTPDAGDFSIPGLFLGEIEGTLGGKKLKKQEFMVPIKAQAPTT